MDDTDNIEIDEEEFDDAPIGKKLGKNKTTDDEDYSESGSEANSDDLNSNTDNSDIDDEDEEDDDMDDDTEADFDEDIKGKTIENNATTERQNAFVDISDDDDDDEEDNDENYLQKFGESIQNKIIDDSHPELKYHNNDEIEILSRVVRDENGNIIDPLHKTLPFLTKYEKARIIGERAKQLNSGAIPTIEIESNIIDGYLIALKEFEQKKIPFIVKRPLPNGGCEYWRFSDLEVIG